MTLFVHFAHSFTLFIRLSRLFVHFVHLTIILIVHSFIHSFILSLLVITFKIYICGPPPEKGSEVQIFKTAIFFSLFDNRVLPVSLRGFKLCYYFSFH